MIVEECGTIVAFGSLRKEHFDNIKPYDFINALRGIPARKVFVSDSKNSWYANFDQSAIIPYLTERTVFVGHSAGAYAAILFGCKLNVSAVIAYAPQTFMDSKWKGFNPDGDINDIIRSSLTKVYVPYCKDCQSDKAHVEHISNNANVVPVPDDCGNHNIARRQVKNGDFKNLLIKIFGEQE